MSEPPVMRDVEQLANTLAERERELHEANERLALILENAPVFVYVIDRENRFLSASRSWLEANGIDRERVLGRTLSEVFPQAAADQFAENNRRVLRANAVLRFEESYEDRTYLSVKVPVRNATGEPHAICGMSIDISERKQMEEALRESEDRFRSFTDGLPLIVWVHNAEGAQEFVNHTFCEFFGVKPDQMRGDQWEKLMHPDDAEAYASKFRECVRARRPFHAEVRVRRSDGAWRWIESWGRPRVSSSGAFLGFVGTSADITERKVAERRARGSEAALRDADRKKDEFIAMLAHELRNPLAPIRTAASILKAQSAGRPELERASGIVERQVGQLVRLVDDLLDIGRITSDRLQLHATTLDLREVVEHALQISAPVLEEARHRMQLSLPDDPVLVEGDPVRLAQIVSNLLNNAARYTPNGGDVSLRLEREDTEAVLRVADSGIGLQADALDRIFEPFAQLGDDCGRSAGGLGVGLALSKRLAEMHGGSIRASSPGPGRGSCFTVRLPCVSGLARGLGDPPR